ncbi:MAG: SlyX protein [Saprospiraceae bacterium]|jgi:SlyX protein|tara:strand:- start:144 stop:401 length:258 start_codon:yes stop_codon:yes gene_type:complete
MFILRFFYIGKYFLETAVSIERIIELETKMAYQEDAIRQLNDVVCRQQNQIDALVEKCKQLISSTKVLSTKLSEEPESTTKPPHY